MYEVSRSAVLLEGEKSTIFSLEQGVAQGCSLSPEKKINQLHSVISNRDVNLTARRLLLLSVV